MTIIIIFLLVLLLISQIRIFGIVKAIMIRAQETDPKIHFIYEQLLKEHAEKTTKN